MADMNPVKDSSAITGHSYDTETRKLRVRFKGGSTYEYDDVPPEKYVAFTGAASPGTFHNRKIRPIHNGRKVRE